MSATESIVAVVDDDRSVANALARALRAAGYTVRAFGSGQELLGSLAVAVPGCLVLDVQMPGMDGFELESRLRGLGHHVPVLFITAHDSPQARAAASRSGVLGLLFKPFRNAALLEAVGRVLGSPSTPRAASSSGC